VNAKVTLDLIIVDIPEDLLVPTISEPADAVPPWNQSADSLTRRKTGINDYATTTKIVHND
jgi:hypothetical protein